MDAGIQIRGKSPAEAGRVLTPDALAFVAKLSGRQERFDAGELPRFLTETESVRKADWKVASTPAACARPARSSTPRSKRSSW